MSGFSQSGLILGVVLALGLLACSPPEGPALSGGAASIPLDNVGRATCEGCHEQEAARWSGSHHDLAMQEATEANVLGDFDDASFTYADVTSTFSRRDGAFFVRTDGPHGELAEYQIAYTFGVEPLQQYLIGFPDGRYQALSICWDTRPASEGGQRWFHLYPDEEIDHRDPLHWTGPQQNWNFMCAECHSTGLGKGYDAASDRYATTWSEIDVSCESCHGPGSRHVAWAEAVENGDADPDGSRALAVDLVDRDGGVWVFDSETGIARRSVPRADRVEVEMCARCHARRSLVSEAYVHGRPLMDTHRPALLEEGLYHADGQIQDEVYVYGSFLQSRMYREGVTCTDCHDPHTAELAYGSADATCSRCHLPKRFASREHHFHEPGTAGASCVECHMPQRKYMVIDGRRDHSFRVPRPDVSARIGTPNACGDCHDDRTAAWAAEAVAEWYGEARRGGPHWGEALDAGRRALPDASRLLRRAAADAEVPGIARATALASLAAHPAPDVVALVERAVSDPDPLVRVAAVRAAEGLPPPVRLQLLPPLLEDPLRTVRIHAARALAGAPPELLPADQRELLIASLEEYRLSLEANAERPEAHVSLGNLAIERGDSAPAEAAYRRALEIDPGHVPAYANLADLYRQMGREAQGDAVLRQGLARVPESADLLHALGLALIRQGRRDEALDLLARAAELRPNEARFGYVYGVALHSLGSTKRAIEVLERTLESAPADRDVLAALATMSRDAGRPGEALRYAQRLVSLYPDDPGARQLLGQIQALD